MTIFEPTLNDLLYTFSKLQKKLDKFEKAKIEESTLFQNWANAASSDAQRAGRILKKLQEMLS